MTSTIPILVTDLELVEDGESATPSDHAKATQKLETFELPAFLQKQTRVGTGTARETWWHRLRAKLTV